MFLGRKARNLTILGLSFMLIHSTVFADPNGALENQAPVEQLTVAEKCKAVLGWIVTNRISKQVQREKVERTIRIIRGGRNSSNMTLEQATKIVREDWIKEAKEYSDLRKRYQAAIRILEIWKERMAELRRPQLLGWWKFKKTDGWWFAHRSKEYKAAKGEIVIENLPRSPSLDGPRNVTADTSVLDTAPLPKEKLIDESFSTKAKFKYDQRKISEDLEAAKKGLEEEDVRQAVRMKYLGRLLNEVERQRPGTVARILNLGPDPNDPREAVILEVKRFIDEYSSSKPLGKELKAPEEIQKKVESAIYLDSTTQNLKLRKIAVLLALPWKGLMFGLERVKRAHAFYGLIIALPTFGGAIYAQAKYGLLWAHYRDSEKVAQVQLEEKQYDTMRSITSTAEDLKEFFKRNRKEIFTPDFRDEALTILIEYLATVLDIEIEGNHPKRYNLEPDGSYEAYIFDMAKKMRTILLEEIYGNSEKELEGAGGKMNRRANNNINLDEKIRPWTEDNGLLKMGELIKEYMKQEQPPAPPADKNP